jgi:hypothetical protein
MDDNNNTHVCYNCQELHKKRSKCKTCGVTICRACRTKLRRDYGYHNRDYCQPCGEKWLEQQVEELKNVYQHYPDMHITKEFVLKHYPSVLY